MPSPYFITSLALAVGGLESQAFVLYVRDICLTPYTLYSLFVFIFFSSTIYN